MTVAWNNGAYYGKKTRRYFRYLDTMINRLFKEASKKGTQIDNETLEQILKLTGRQNTLTHTIVKLVDTLDIDQRLSDMEKLMDAVTPEALSAARERIPDWRDR